jgi:hypothetical protein
MTHCVLDYQKVLSVLFVLHPVRFYSGSTIHKLSVFLSNTVHDDASS